MPENKTTSHSRDFDADITLGPDATIKRWCVFQCTNAENYPAQPILSLSHSLQYFAEPRLSSAALVQFEQKMWD